MPRIESAKKRVRQNEKRTAHNKSRRSKMRTLIKKVHQSEDPEEAKSFQKDAESYLDRMVVKGLVHKNKAARRKSQMDRHIKSLENA